MNHHTHNTAQDTPRVEAMVQRAARVPGGYAMAVHVATTVPVQAWQARVVLDSGAEAQPGPGTTWDGTITTGSPQAIRAGGHATAWLGVQGTEAAPRHIQVAVLDTDGNEVLAPVAQVMVNDPSTGRARQATNQDWEGAEALTGPGSGGGGGGGGGGQYTCDLYVDLERRIVSHRITSDAGGGGGSGGGGGHHSNHQQRYGASQ